MLFTARLTEEDVAALRAAERVSVCRWDYDAVDVICSSRPRSPFRWRSGYYITATAKCHDHDRLGRGWRWQRGEDLDLSRRGWCGPGWSTLQGEVLEAGFVKGRPYVRLLSRERMF